MKSLFIVTLMTLLTSSLLSGSISADDAMTLGYREDTQIIPREDEEICPGATLLQNDDGRFENGYSWVGGRVKRPDYGAWAECYDTDYVCGVRFLFTQNGYFDDQTMDVYVWDYDADGNIPPGPDPGNVLSVLRDITPEMVAFWPYFSTHDVRVCCVTDGPHFVGFWGNWPGQMPAWYIGADEDGPQTSGSRTRYKINSTVGGDWMPVIEIYYEECKALGIRELSGISICHSASAPEPANHETTWGAIKSFY